MRRYEMVRGAKYESTRHLDTAGVARLYRQEIKDAVKAGELPAGLKTSVRISRFAGGSDIRVEILAAPEVAILNPERVVLNRAEPYAVHPECHYPTHTEAGKKLLADLEARLKSYGYDGSDTSSDYFNVRFYHSVSYAHDLLKREEDRIVADNSQLLSHAL